VSRLTDLVDELVAQRAEERLGSMVSVLVESVDGDAAEGRAEHQAPEVDGTTALRGFADVAVGDIVDARVVATDGVDLVAEPVRQ
jgi:ribosomal protein S12 methylthiotransferase